VPNPACSRKQRLARSKQAVTAPTPQLKSGCVKAHGAAAWIKALAPSKQTVTWLVTWLRFPAPPLPLCCFSKVLKRRLSVCVRRSLASMLLLH